MSFDFGFSKFFSWLDLGYEFVEEDYRGKLAFLTHHIDV